MEAVARISSCPMSAQKMRLVIDNIRGKDVDMALNILRNTKREAAIWLEKLVMSAAANWADRNGMSVTSIEEYDLYIKTAYADGATMLKRFQPAPHGRAHRIRKRTTHVTIIVANRVPLKEEVESTEEASEEAAG